MDHTYVICAYKESPYLEECIQSLKAQTVKSTIIMVTSTPCDYIQNICQKEEIQLYINDGPSGITQDWNFGISRVKSQYATIAHQDDTYEPDYTKKVVGMMEKYGDSLIAFSDYSELRNGKKVYNEKILKIKRMMLMPLRRENAWKSIFWRRRVLSLGDPICCPAVSFNLYKVSTPIFQDGFRSCEDWEAWEQLSKKQGRFVYIHESLMNHRIHEDSTTSQILKDNARIQENYDMYCKFWPKFIAKQINKQYTKSEESNNL